MLTVGQVITETQMNEEYASDFEVSITRYSESDAGALCDVNADPEHRKRFDFPDDFMPSIQHAKTVISSWNREFDSNSRYAFAIRIRNDGTLIGGCELKPKADGTANVSYWVHPRHRRKGIASRAVGLLSNEIAPKLGLSRLELLTDSDNLASRGVARNCGYAESGMRNGQVFHLLKIKPDAQLGGQPDAFGAGYL